MGKFSGLKSISIVISLTIVMCFFMNCSGPKAHFFDTGAAGSNATSAESADNGQGYGGKIGDGTYLRQLEGHRCERQAPGLQGILQVISGGLNLTLDNCVDLAYDMTSSDSRVEFAPYNPDFIGINHAIFERQNSVQPSSRISEAWCRWTQPREGLDAVIRLDSTGPVTSQMYLGSSQDSMMWNSRIVSPVNVQRSVNSSGFSYTGESFNLQIDSAMNSSGQFQGRLRASVDGRSYDVAMNCRMMQRTSALTLVDPNLVGLWQMNNSFLDVSGLGNNAVSTDANSSVIFEAGHFQQGVRLIDNDDVISVAPSASLNNLVTLSAAAWIRGDPDPTAPLTLNGGSILWKGQPTPTSADPTNLNLLSGWYFGIPAQSGRLEFKVVFSGSVLHAYSNSNGLRLRPNQWHHVAVTWSGAAQASTIRFYIDGQLATLDPVTVDGVGARISDGANPLKMGFYSDNLYNTLRGSLDQVQIWNRVLTAPEINNLYNTGTLVP